MVVISLARSFVLGCWLGHILPKLLGLLEGGIVVIELVELRSIDRGWLVCIFACVLLICSKMGVGY